MFVCRNAYLSVTVAGPRELHVLSVLRVHRQRRLCVVVVTVLWTNNQVMYTVPVFYPQLTGKFFSHKKRVPHKK